ncbi:MAG: hypothetical protein HOP12_03560 [Candidatus Eisenbacteria bacterium]|uniref:Uncharacterized protein n=1 Tax=Eiseniibacteriota bacterium TaxID=2212470 RepID=A0A849SC22_UNCEI|nr:hypothetical protein [Candidatus Eisenbacteria bacterium]
MKSKDCFEPEALAEVFALSESDPRRRHARDCPRCSSLLESYRLFLSPGSELQSDHVARAAARLDEVVASMTGIAGSSARPIADATSGKRSANATGLSWLERLLHPSLRPALAFAVLALVLGGVAVWPRLAMTPAPRGGEPVLRGERAIAEFALGRAELGVGGLDLEWAGVSDAEGYVVRIFTPELQEIGTLGPLSTTSFHSALANLPFTLPAGETIVVQVAAVRSGDTLGTSRARVLIAP